MMIALGQKIYFIIFFFFFGIFRSLSDFGLRFGVFRLTKGPQLISITLCYDMLLRTIYALHINNNNIASYRYIVFKTTDFSVVSHSRLSFSKTFMPPI